MTLVGAGVRGIGCTSLTSSTVGDSVVEGVVGAPVAGCGFSMTGCIVGFCSGGVVNGVDTTGCSDGFGGADVGSFGADVGFIGADVGFVVVAEDVGDTVLVGIVSEAGIVVTPAGIDVGVDVDKSGWTGVPCTGLVGGWGLVQYVGVGVSDGHGSETGPSFPGSGVR